MNTHEMDQIEAATRDIAKILATYKKQLIDEGFSSMEAIMLVAAYQATLITAGNNLK